MSDLSATIGLLPGSIEEKRPLMTMAEPPASVGPITAALGQALAPQPSPGGVCISLPIESFTEPRGLVRGAMENDQPADVPQSAWLLPAGQVMCIDEGTSISVLSDLNGRKSEWVACEMPHGGEIQGPLVWGWREPSRVKDITQRRAKSEARETADDMSFWVFVFGWLAMTFGAFCYMNSWATFSLGALASFFGGLLAAGTTVPLATPVIARRDRRGIKEFEPMGNLSVRLPTGIKEMLSPTPVIDALPKPGADFSGVQTHDEVRTALQQLSKTWERHEANDAREPRSQGSRAARARLNHTVGTIAQIAGQIAEHPAVAEREEVRLPFLQLIADAEDSLRRFEMDCDDQRSREVLASIRALATQLVSSSSVPSKAVDKSTQS